MKKFLICIAVFCLLLGAAGCAAKREVLPEPRLQAFAKPEEIKLDVYLDGTYSMAGYVDFPTTTRYVEAIKEIERVAAANWRKEEVRYIRFGDGFQKLSREEFLGFAKAGFYKQLDTSLQKVVDRVEDGKVSIIVTDLFQTDQDLENLAASLKKKSFSKREKALALIGVRSQFRGKIYDIGKNRAAFDYATSGEGSYRPFYLLVLGDEADVRCFARQYQHNLGGRAEALLFSRNLGVEARLFVAAEKRAADGKKDKAAPMAKIGTLVKNKDVLQFRLKLDEKASRAALRVHAKEAAGALPQKYFLAISSVEKWEQKAGAFQKIEAKDFLQASACELRAEGGEMDLSFLLRVNPLGINKRAGKYKVDFALVPEKEAYLESMSVFDAWNFSDAEVRGDDFRAFGSKTLNIAPLVKTLASLNYEVNKPGLHELALYFDAVK